MWDLDTIVRMNEPDAALQTQGLALATNGVVGAVKLTILMTGDEVMGLELVYKNDLWFVRSCGGRPMIPLYEFKCDNNLTKFLNVGIFKKANAQEASS